MTLRAPHSTRLTASFALSATIHVGFAAILVFLSRSERPPVLPPVYRVNIVAAPAGPRAIGDVRPAPVEDPEARPRPVAEVEPRRMPSPERSPAARPIRRATPVPTTTPARRTRAPTAGGGPIGGRGADVATVQTSGIEFPFPGYLNNIVRQIALRFAPPDRDAKLRAEMMFLIRRDGSVTGVRFVTRSGSYAFDLEAEGAIEAAAAARAFGPLPEEFPDDVLPVFFSFDPQVLR